MQKFLAVHFTRAWSRWWSARLVATTYCSKWLHEGNPDFTHRQRAAKGALCLMLFIVPIDLPVRVQLTTSREPSNERRPS